jgi:tetratricopeptide (TPR) repeat protein
VLDVAEGDVAAHAGKSVEGIRQLEAAARVCREKNFYGQLINALRNLGNAYVLAHRGADAIAAVHEAIDLHARAKVWVTRAQKHAVLAAAHLQLGELDRAQAELDTTLELAERHGERGVEGRARLTGAELALARGDRALAEELLDGAQEIAEELGMAPLVERCRAFSRRLA